MSINDKCKYRTVINDLNECQEAMSKALNILAYKFLQSLLSKTGLLKVCSTYAKFIGRRVQRPVGSKS